MLTVSLKLIMFILQRIYVAYTGPPDCRFDDYDDGIASHRIAMLLVPAEVFRFCCFSLLLISGDFYFHLLLIKREKQYAYTHSISFHFGSNRIHSEKDA